MFTTKDNFIKKKGCIFSMRLNVKKLYQEKGEINLTDQEKQFNKIQLDMMNKVNLKNNFDISDINIIAGVDLAYWNEGDVEKAVCCIVVMDYNSKNILERQQHIGTITIPYMPGYLAFRELPLILETVKKLKTKPDIFMFDGNGYLHVRHMGIATHASFYLNKPVIGVAKSYYKIDETNCPEVDNYDGAFCDIIIKDEVYGRAYRSHKNVKPIFISVGNNIDLDTSMQICKNMITNESRIPLPTRLADIDTHEYRKKARLVHLC